MTHRTRSALLTGLAAILTLAGCGGAGTPVDVCGGSAGLRGCAEMDAGADAAPPGARPDDVDDGDEGDAAGPTDARESDTRVGAGDLDAMDEDAGVTTAVPTCDDSPCDRGSCVQLDDGVRCDCDEGFEGADCSIDVDECADVSCGNGRCIDGVASRTCECDEGWAGASCETNIALDFIAQVIAANEDPDPDVITLTSDVTLDAVHNTTDGPNGVPVITTPIRIEGDDFTIRRAPGSPQFRLFAVSSTGQLTLDDVGIEGGDIDVGDDCFTEAAQCGGGVLVRFGTLSVGEGTRFMGNTAHGGGAIFNAGGTVSIDGATFGAPSTPNTAESGGAIRSVGNSAQVTILDTRFEGNVANTAGGAIENQGAMYIGDCVFAGNVVTTAPGFGGGGGAIYNTTLNGQLRIANSSFTSNAAPHGGAMSNYNASDIVVHDSVFSGNETASFGDGGAIWSENNALLALHGSRVEDNTADGHGGGIFAGMNLNSELLLSRSTVARNVAGRDGGGVYMSSSNASVVSHIEHAVIEDNVAGRHGGGIYKDGISPLHVLGSTIRDNRASIPNGAGGGLYVDNPTSNAHAHTIIGSTISGNQSGQGGGIYSVAFTGSITIEDTTIHGNRVITNGAVGEGGAAIMNQHGTVEVSHSTLSGNRVETSGGALSGSGAAIHNGNGGVVNVSYCTIADNASADGGGVRAAATVTVASSILANTADDGPNCNPFLTVADGGNNFVSDATNCPGGFTESAALGLGPLADNGGPLLTHALLAGSPAIDATGDCGVDDQRGAPRDATCDAGALEAVAPALPTVQFDAATSSVDEASGTGFTVSVTLDNTAGDLTAGEVRVALRVGGTAAWGNDYDADATPVVTFSGATWPAPGASATQTIGLNVQADARPEADETIVLTLEDPGLLGPAELGTPTQHVVTIGDGG
ncbi:MAG: choice-of-anchor Q domain-containing protein [Myxococcales bacterium]